MAGSFYKRLSPTALAVLDLVPYEGGCLITRINVPKAWRGQGVASGLLREAIEWADSREAVLWLEVQPSDGLSHKVLLMWYRRNGFEDTGAGMLLRRAPSGGAAS